MLLNWKGIGIKRTHLDLLKRFMRILGITMVVPFVAWFALGFIPGVPSIIDVFGIDDLKLPTGVVIGGLLIAAFGFEDF